MAAAIATAAAPNRNWSRTSFSGIASATSAATRWPAALAFAATWITEARATSPALAVVSEARSASAETLSTISAGCLLRHLSGLGAPRLDPLCHQSGDIVRLPAPCRRQCPHPDLAGFSSGQRYRPRRGSTQSAGAAATATPNLPRWPMPRRDLLLPGP